METSNDHRLRACRASAMRHAVRSIGRARKDGWGIPLALHSNSGTQMQLVLITGLSGSGKSVALNALEDAGYYCVDNLPVSLVPDLVGFLEQAGHSRVALSIDVRSGQTLDAL